MHKLFTVCTEQVRSPYPEHAASGLHNLLIWRGRLRFDQAQDQQVVTTRSPRIVTECLLIRSMLIKKYVHVYAIYSRFRIVLRSEGSLKCEMLSLARTSKYVDYTSVLSIT